MTEFNKMYDEEYFFIDDIDSRLSACMAKSFVKYILDGIQENILSANVDVLSEVKRNLNKLYHTRGTMLSPATIRELRVLMYEYFITEKVAVLDDLIDEAIKNIKEDTSDVVKYIIETCYVVDFGLSQTAEGILLSETLLNELCKSKTNLEKRKMYIYKYKSEAEENKNDDMMQLAIKAENLNKNVALSDLDENVYAQLSDALDNQGICGDEVVIYKIKDRMYVESLKRAYQRLLLHYGERNYRGCKIISMSDGTVSIYNSRVEDFVVWKFLYRNNSSDWFLIKLSNGRTLIATSKYDIATSKGDKKIVSKLDEKDAVWLAYSTYKIKEPIEINSGLAWLGGLIMLDGQYSDGITVTLGKNEDDILKRIEQLAKVHKFEVSTMERNNEKRGYEKLIRLKFGKNLSKYQKRCIAAFGGTLVNERKIPENIFISDEDVKCAFLAGILDAKGSLSAKGGTCRGRIDFTNREIALQIMVLANTLGCVCKQYIINCNNPQKIKYRLEFELTKKICKKIQNKEKKKDLKDEDFKSMSSTILCSVLEIIPIQMSNEAYTVICDSKNFDASGIII